jgi:hypothetical protein
MKKSTVTIIVIVAIFVLAIIFWFAKQPSTTGPVNTSSGTPTPSTQTVSAPVTETTKVSSQKSQYSNAELGFAVTYPTSWEADPIDSGVTFIIPIDTTQVSTIAKLEADINTVSGKCAFPPVTSVSDRGTLTVAGLTANMISITNNVQGRTYTNRMYELQSGAICYVFTFSSIAQSASVKGLTGSNATQAQNNNKAIVKTADADFTTMVKSFSFVAPAAGKDESTVK